MRRKYHRWCPIIAVKKGKYIHLYHKEQKRRLRYDLKSQSLEKLKDDRWYWVSQDYKFFKGVSIREFKIKNRLNDDKFDKLLSYAKRINPRCRSVSTFITRLPMALVYEQYIYQGVKHELRTYGYYDTDVIYLKKPLSFYNKRVINFFKEHEIEVTRKLEYNFRNNYDLLTKIIISLMDIKLDEYEKNIITEEFVMMLANNDIEEFLRLVDEYNYDYLSLLKYVFFYLKPFENFNRTGEAFRLLLDYYRMADIMSRKVKKYPKYLKSMHDIISSNYNSFHKNYDELAFKRIAKNNLVHKGKKYCVVVPDSSKDVISEGTSLNHCVSSYVDDILAGRTYIMFMRFVEKEDESLITLEYKKGSIVQAKGSYNRALSKEEYEYLQGYCKNKKIELEVKSK